jgi:hypothetical protein
MSVTYTPRFFFFNDPDVNGPIRQLNPNITDKELKQILKEKWKELDNESIQKYQDMADKDANQTSNTTVLVPKKAKNAYMQYITDSEIIQKAQDLDPSLKGKYLNKHLSTLWNQLSKDQQQPWVDKYQEDKQKLLDNPVMITKKSKKPAVTQTITQHKQAKTPFFHYSQDTKVKQDHLDSHPNMTPNELKKLLGSNWKSMTPEQQQPWIDRHDEEKKQLLETPIMITKKVKIQADLIKTSLELKIEELQEQVRDLTEKYQQVIEACS